MSDHELTQAYYDGELAPDDEARAVTHLAGCAQCQRDLADWMQLEGAAIDAPAASPSSVRAGSSEAPAPAPVPIPAPMTPPPPTPPPSPTPPSSATTPSTTHTEPPRAHGRRWLAIPVVIAAAAAAWLMLRPARPRGPTPAPAIALAAQRVVEIRVADPTLDRHRPYGAPRSDDAAGELLPMAVVARLETQAPVAYTGALLLGGELRRAAATLDAAPVDPARDVDRAGLALLRREPLAALAAADRALRVGAPALEGAARWNRALALRDLELPRAAAAELDRVAALAEPGWSDEARQRAGALRAPLDARDRALAELQRVGPIMADGGPAIAADLARQFPTLARLYLHDALRLAGTVDAVRALRPVGEAIDAASPGAGAGGWIDRVASADPTVRAGFADRYRAVRDHRLVGAELERLLGDLDRAGPAVADVLIGAIILGGATASHVDLLTRVADATGDPWFAMYAAGARAGALRDQGALDLAEATLRASLARCPAGVPYRCANLELALARLLLTGYRLDEAADHAAIARRGFAGAGGPTSDRVQALTLLAEIDRVRGRFTSMAAFFAEARATDGSCGFGVFVDEALATAAYWRSDVALARALAPAVGACDLAPSPVLLQLRVDLARQTGDAADVATARRTIDAAAASPDPATRWLAGPALGRLMLDGDRAAGRARLEAAIGGPPPAELAPAAWADLRQWAYAALIDDAAASGDHARALTLALAELGQPAIAGCVMATSLDDDRWSTVARGADGQLRGARGRTGRVLTVDSATLVPSDLRAALTGCDRIAVIARPPLHGRADLLPPALPWALIGPTTAQARAPHGGPALIVRDARPPAALGLPVVGTAVVEHPGDVTLAGDDASPSRVLAALADASYVELHAHGLLAPGAAASAVIALSPDRDGRFTLSGTDLAAAHLGGAPVVVLAACRAAAVTLEVGRRWSLPDALLAAGASAVIATTAAIPDDDAVEFSTSLRARLAGGESPEAAIAAERTRGDRPWRAQLLVFR